MEAIGSWVMVYLSNSFNWEQERIFMLILRFAYKDNTICKKRVGKILILGIKILFLHQLIDYVFKSFNIMLNIVIFGAPGSGKGTQSERIVAKYGINHISTGDVLRAQIKAGTELGKTAKGYIDQGQLLPDELIIDILASTLDSFQDSKGVIFDGFPRTIAQAEALKAMLAERGQEVSIMLDLDVPEDELMTRLIKRGQESGRADDNEETIKKRLVVYHSQTSPLIDWYKNDGKYQHINGLGTMEGIFAEIAEAIDKI